MVSKRTEHFSYAHHIPRVLQRSTLYLDPPVPRTVYYLLQALAPKKKAYTITNEVAKRSTRSFRDSLLESPTTNESKSRRLAALGQSMDTFMCSKYKICGLGEAYLHALSHAIPLHCK